jgi:hypothetical protein
MRISETDLKRLQIAPTALPAPVEPQLTLAEEVVLLSLDASRGRIRDAVALAGRAHDTDPHDYRAAVRSLQDRGLLERTGINGKLRATDAARLTERQRRVVAVVRRAATPIAPDAELLVLLADCHALSLGRDDHLHARMRIASIREGGEMPPVVELLRTRIGVTSMSELAEALLPASRDLRDANFDPGVTSGVWAASMLNC